MTYRLLPILAVLALVACTDKNTKEDKKPTETSIATPADWPNAKERRARNIAPTASEVDKVLLRGATIWTATGERIEGGDLLLLDGKIAAISKEPLEVKEGVEIIDVTGKFITPGLIDTHSHLGVYPTPNVEAHSDGNEASAPTTPDVNAEHSVWPQDPGFQRALAGGITALQILPGSANLIGGRSATLQLHPGISSAAMRFPGAPGGVKMACGENPKRVYGSRGGKPSTRMGNMAVWRQTFQKAAETRDAWDDYAKKLAQWSKDPNRKEDKKPKEPSLDIGQETLVRILRGELLVHVHCYRADEMIQVLQLADEFGFEVRSFHHAVEAYKIRDVLAEWDVSVSTWADWWGFKIEAHDAILQNAGLLDEAGARAIIHSDSEIDIQRLNQEAAKAYWAAKHAGVDVTEEDALRWITINAAWALGIDDVTGTLEEGKRADVVVWSANPLSVYASAEIVWVEGVREFDASKNPTPWSDFEAGQLPVNVPIVPQNAKKGGKQ
ncbi:MAG: amidohydrolase family protein [Myxococcota bacterium]|nr:amidohydrolase family protein [Myxococcota bacterium]